MAAAVISRPSFSQGTVVVGALLAGFALYLAATNRFGTYLSLLFGKVTQTSASAGAGQTPTTAPPASAGAGWSQLPGTLLGPFNPQRLFPYWGAPDWIGGFGQQGSDGSASAPIPPIQQGGSLPMGSGG